MIKLIVLYVLLVALLGAFGKLLQKMFIEGMERAGKINTVDEYLRARKRAHVNKNV
jgi:high-affinity K+ transport system ATPase subunit B